MKIHNDLRDVSEGTLDFPSDQNDVSEAILQIHSDQSDVLMVTREISPCQKDVTLVTSKIDNGHPDIPLAIGKIPSAFREMNPVGGKIHRLFPDVETGVANSPAIKAAEGPAVQDASRTPGRRGAAPASWSAPAPGAWRGWGREPGWIRTRSRPGRVREKPNWTAICGGNSVGA
jgi:hypothetical protein